jgi:hypothetical protein
LVKNQSKGAHLGERKGGGQLRKGLGEWKHHKRGALGSGKITHLLKLERGAWFKLGESSPNQWGAQQVGREGLRRVELVREESRV